MHYGNIKNYDIADGEGVRVTLFCSGCTNRCEGCFQPETWDFCYGKEYTKETEDQLIQMLTNPNIQGLTLLGGDPFEPSNQRTLITLLRRVKQELPTKDVWAYTGFVYEQDLLEGQRKHTEVTDEMLSYIDVLVDGPFVIDEKDISLYFRGSTNQRVIDMPKTLKSGNVVIYHE
ncbi:anaerobic ribonucleoside-triphosphate reductase activating protein [Erysipelotrichaceae bacterium]|jgi:anaerobic ribonucleoside-triphosphate reductase activating protein|uniref:anaerobic ribonucleoside-triphosphate reductase activating protein n=1 Tax=unclassified Bulleidia TaxID=2704656 RepID=UPI0015B78CC7|nr:anaerobic ribonucleoside-triphosphate reductase activating protein [Erysipelotrichaceae bacterium 7770_A6]MCI7724601.1 anaerobic ribonucleoside-triphosphate reductase activating protein [Erysipelotrichaceae bacterium]MDY3659643.1 anaerobic ribonucleoside-triphosphate reductase activating protein [Bulleidia sp.]MEE0558500.1 anaerobic ribonucleoside-triphosphate reductase activating protein [Bulleidia sp.]